MRSGQDIYNSLCDKLKGSVDVNATYDTASLIALFRNHPDFHFNDLLDWLFKGSDWNGDATMKTKSIAALNNMITAHQGGNDIDGYDEPSVVNLDLSEMNSIVAYYSCCTPAEKENIKQTLCDKILEQA